MLEPWVHVMSPSHDSVIDGKKLIVLTGPSGVELEHLADYMASSSKSKVRVLKYENYLEEVSGGIGGIIGVLVNALQPRQDQFSKFFEAAEHLVEDAKSINADVIALVAHSYYYRSHHLIPNPGLERILRLWRPRAIVVAVDDYYHGLDRIARRVEEKKTPPLSDILDPNDYLTWRALTTFHAQVLGRLFKSQVIVLALKHRRLNVQRLSRLLFDDAPMKTFYLSHHITIPRREASEQGIPLREHWLVREIENLKTKLLRSCKNLILYEPTAIDELIPGNDVPLSKVVDQDNRWPHYDTPGYASFNYPLDIEEDILGKLTSLKLNKEYAEYLASRIKAQIPPRDLKMIEQSQGVIAYKPVYEGKVSEGMSAEIPFAVANDKTVIIYDEEKRGAEELGLFRHSLSIVYEDVEHLKTALGC